MNESDVVYRSSLASALSKFVEFKRAEGYDYKSRAKRLRKFDRFLCENSYSKRILTREIIDKYIAENATLSPAARLADLSPVRVFSKHLRLFEPNSHVVGLTPFRVPTGTRRHLFSRAETSALIRAARDSSRGDPAMRRCLPILFGLLHSTGLRIREALDLNVENVDLERNILFVRRGKFGKDRHVAIHPSVAKMVAEWLETRKRIAPAPDSGRLFVNGKGFALKYGTVRKRFHNLVVELGIGADEPRTPRLHDFRHTYASERLEKWRTAGDDVNAKLPILATAMGHVNVQATSLYLHATGEGLRRAGDLFRFHALNPNQ